MFFLNSYKLDITMPFFGFCSSGKFKKVLIRVLRRLRAMLT